MMINDEKKLVFIHIPKNGGTSIRTELGKFGFVSPFAANKIVEGNVTIDAPHQTPLEIRERFPDLAARILGYRQILVLRSPSRRFLSSVSQYLRMYSKKIPTAYSPVELHSVVLQLLDSLEIGEISFKMTHFRRQIDYLSSTETQILLRLEDATALEASLKDLVDPNFSLARKFSRRFVRNRPARAIKKVIDPIFRAMPEAARTFTKRMFEPLLYKKRLPTDELIGNDAVIWARVTAYYAQDIELYAKVS